ncbi:SlyX protein, putative [Oceanicola granulosus HTCC2516]|uniref:SlyX protein, putative n=1 Tax=Oceanicola granulosus (strain ATCC BAA-861 / DSM 15982 / KCTC 12143 / HTCC2516) TaxID=314256 RepID=Q2CAP0_OCEGH|nr:SlyX family protein [Oceanicola granulosus]EAR49754.1 SlyX protein, putative [Oceanicola granulosus HTCC2516]
MSEVMEERIAYLERELADLSDVVTRQSGEIAALTRRMAMLLEREAGREAEEAGTVPLADQRPPHW